MGLVDGRCPCGLELGELGEAGVADDAAGEELVVVVVVFGLGRGGVKRERKKVSFFSSRKLERKCFKKKK